MFFIMKFNQQLFAAARPVAMAAQRGDVETALKQAPSLLQVARRLEAEAARKSHGALIGGNDQVYASMSLQARSFADAAQTILSSSSGGGQYNQALYQAGIRQLEHAIASGG